MASYEVSFDPSLLVTDIEADYMVQNQGAFMVIVSDTEVGLDSTEATYVDPLGTFVFPMGTSMIWARAPSAHRPGQSVRVFLSPIAPEGTF